jgi:ADP-ribosyl-[dinitrogen reductase] hydrolase
MRSGGRHFRKAGQWTDDTLQAVAVAESLCACGGFDASDLIRRFLAGFRERPEWYGPTSSLFFTLVASGIPADRAAWLVHRRNHGSRSNGSVMRGFPIGIFYPPDSAYETSIPCSRLSHYDPVSGHCSVWLNVMVSGMCRGVSRHEAFRSARSLCTNAEVHAVLGNYERYDPDPSLDAVRCSHAALTCFMNALTFENAVLSAINLGGDADTVGACCGALAGACWGLEAIPARWRCRLEGFNRLCTLADKLWEGRVDGPRQKK